MKRIWAGDFGTAVAAGGAGAGRSGCVVLLVRKDRSEPIVWLARCWGAQRWRLRAGPTHSGAAAVLHVVQRLASSAGASPGPAGFQDRYFQPLRHAVRPGTSPSLRLFSSGRCFILCAGRGSELSPANGSWNMPSRIASFPCCPVLHGKCHQPGQYARHVNITHVVCLHVTRGNFPHSVARLANKAL